MIKAAFLMLLIKKQLHRLLGAVSTLLIVTNAV